MRRACERGIRVFDFGRSKRDVGSFPVQETLGVRARVRLRDPSGPRDGRSGRQSAQSEVPHVRGVVETAPPATLAAARTTARTQSRLSAPMTELSSPTGSRTRRTRGTRSDRSCGGAAPRPPATIRRTGATNSRKLCASGWSGSSRRSRRSRRPRLRRRAGAQPVLRKPGASRLADPHGLPDRARVRVLVSDGAVRFDAARRGGAPSSISSNPMSDKGKRLSVGAAGGIAARKAAPVRPVRRSGSSHSGLRRPARRSPNRTRSNTSPRPMKRPICRMRTW